VLARRGPPRKEGKTFVPQQGIGAGRDAVARRNPAVTLRPRPRVPQSEYASLPITMNSNGRWKRALHLLVVRWQRLRPKSRKRPKATMRCIPIERRRVGQLHLLRQAAKEKAIFAKALLSPLFEVVILSAGFARRIPLIASKRERFPGIPFRYPPRVYSREHL